MWFCNSYNYLCVACTIFLLESSALDQTQKIEKIGILPQAGAGYQFCPK